jgi:hypothetical protein
MEEVSMQFCLQHPVPMGLVEAVKSYCTTRTETHTIPQAADIEAHGDWYSHYWII